MCCLFRLFSFSALFVFFLLSCSASVWNIALTEVREKLEKGEFSYFKDLKLDEERLKDAKLLGEGYGYYIGFVFRKANRVDLEERAFALALDQGLHPWAWESGRQLVERFLQRREYVKAENYGRKLLALDPSRKAAQRLLFQALYWQKKDLEAWEIQKNWSEGDFSAKEEEENTLFRGATAARLGLEGWQQYFIRLSREYAADRFHERALGFFEEDPRRYEALTPEVEALVKFKGALAQSRLPAAASAVGPFLKSAGFWDAQGLLEDWEKLNRGPVQALKGADFLEKIRPELSEERLYWCDLNLGRLYRQAARFDQAAVALERALERASDAVQWERTLWLLMSSAFKVGAGKATALMEKYQGGWRDPEYFSDLFGMWLNDSFLDRRFTDIAVVFRAMGEGVFPGDKGDYAYILARLSASGLLDLRKQGIDTSVEELLRTARETRPFSYAAFMARAAEGLSFGLSSDGPQNEAALTGEALAMEKWVMGFLNFGLADEAFETILAHKEIISAPLLRKAIQALQLQDNHRSALRLAYLLFDKPGFSPKRADWELLYPRPFRELVDERAKKERLDPALLYGLLREESGFSPDIKSAAGAIGLSQLMPETAADVSLRLGLKNPDLTDPAVNLSLGARYLAMRLEYFGKASLALMAYNAGIGRVKGWTQELGMLPDELFAEAVPIRETRLYVKKILASTVMYGLLYYNRNLIDTVRLFFPDFH